MIRSMKDIKRQIKSVESTAHITNAMQLVSAAKFRRAKARYDQVQSQLCRTFGILEEMLGRAENLPSKYVREGTRTTYILITSNRGLCGGFNSGLLKVLHQDVAAMKSAGAAIKDLSVFGVGSRGLDHFRRLGYPVLGSFLTPPERMTYGDARRIAVPVLTQIDRNEIDRVVLVYSAYINTLRQEPVVRQVFPLTERLNRGRAASSAASSAAGSSLSSRPAASSVANGPASQTTSGTTGSAAGLAASGATGAFDRPLEPKWRRELEFLPSEQAVLDYMIPKYLEMKIYQAVVESAVCEHAARRAAMENASGNAKEMLAGLSLTYNRARQQAITDELIEIVSGSEAL